MQLIRPRDAFPVLLFIALLGLVVVLQPAVVPSIPDSTLADGIIPAADDTQEPILLACNLSAEDCFDTPGQLESYVYSLLTDCEEASESEAGKNNSVDSPKGSAAENLDDCPVDAFIYSK